MGPLVNTDWLAAELGKPDLVVFDATKYLPNEDKDGQAEFRRAHIPGARYFDIDRDRRPRYRPAAHGPHARPLRQADRRNSACRNASRVVFYDQKGLASAARGWWLMGLFGHDNAAVLDGGLPKWQREGRADRNRRPAAAASRGVSAPTTARPRLRGVGDVLGNVEDTGRTGAGCARRRPLHRRGAGTARRHAQRPHPRLGEPALHRPAERRRHVPLRRCGARAAGAGRRRWLAPGGDKLRLGRDGLHPDAGPAHRRTAGGRGL